MDFRKKITAIQIVLIFLSCAPISLKAEQKEPKSDRDFSADNIILPIVYYTPESSIAGGSWLMRVFRPKHKTLHQKSSNIQFAGIYTLKNQLLSFGSINAYPFDGKYATNLSLSYRNYPTEWYGIGNDTKSSALEEYTDETITAKASIQRHVFFHLFVGPTISYRDVTHVETNNDTRLGRNEVTGSNGGKQTGIGYVVNWDERDNPFYPRHGANLQFLQIYYDENFGSDFNYWHQKLDLRHFFSITEKHTLGFQLLFDRTKGNVPFYALAQLGGRSLLRGIFQGRFRNKTSLAGQIEDRIKIYKNWGAAVFVGAGDVSGKPSGLQFKTAHPAYGFGARYQVSQKNEVNVRLDFAFSEDDYGTYFSVMEAF